MIGKTLLLLALGAMGHIAAMVLIRRLRGDNARAHLDADELHALKDAPLPHQPRPATRIGQTALLVVAALVLGGSLLSLLAGDMASSGLLVASWIFLTATRSGLNDQRLRLASSIAGGAAAGWAIAGWPVAIVLSGAAGMLAHVTRNQDIDPDRILSRRLVQAAESLPLDGLRTDGLHLVARLLQNKARRPMARAWRRSLAEALEHAARGKFDIEEQAEARAAMAAMRSALDHADDREAERAAAHALAGLEAMRHQAVTRFG